MPVELAGPYGDWNWLGPARDGSRVAKAKFHARPVAVRVATNERASEAATELAVLAKVRHPGLAELLDHGSFGAGQGLWVTRSWIEGLELSTWSKGRSERETASVIAHALPPLHALHSAGFVHGDIKAANIIVAQTPAGPRAVLTDFGMAGAWQSLAGSDRVSGSLFHLAPEVLLGGTRSSASDLFALGVMLHEVLLRSRSSARDFYGRFPREDYFTATGTRVEDLPAWSRDIVGALLERDPARRPSSAAKVASDLGSRLGIEDLGLDTARSLCWPALQGRDAWMERLRAELQRPKPRTVWALLPPAEDAAGVSGAVALQLALAGLPAANFELHPAARGSAGSSSLDSWARSAARAMHGRVACCFWTGEWAERDAHLAALARAVAGTIEPVRLVVFLQALAPSTGDFEQSALDQDLPLAMPAIDARTIENYLLEQISGLAPAQERLHALSQLLERSSQGSAAGMNAALATLHRMGVFLWGGIKPSLAPGPLPTSLEAPLPLRPASVVSNRAYELWCALGVAGAPVSLESARFGADLDEERLTSAIAELKNAHMVHWHNAPAGVQLAFRSSPAWARDLSPPVWLRLHARRLAWLEREGASVERCLPHRVESEACTLAEAVERARSCRERGHAELGLVLCEELARQAAGVGRDLDPELCAERALCWCALGHGDRALNELGTLDATSAPRLKALEARVRAQVAWQRHETAAALEWLESARALDPDDGGETLLGRARWLFELQRFDEVLALAASDTRMRERARRNLDALRAMSLARTGQVERARTELKAQLAEAQTQDDAQREAALAINWGTLERRAGSLDLSLSLYAQAAAVSETAGHLPHLAQALALLGGALREAGQLLAAEPKLGEALALRQRLRDRSGSDAVRGMLGLLYLDRGHLPRAVQELSQAGEDLKRAKRTLDAALMQIFAREASARMQDPASQVARVPAMVEVERAIDGDPRGLAALGRALWLEGDRSRAQTMLERSAALSDRLGLGSLASRSRMVLAMLDGDVAQLSVLTQPQTAAKTPDPLALERELVAILGQAPLAEQRLKALAAELEAMGRDDRAARAWIALAARTTDAAQRVAAQTRASKLLAVCCTGAIDLQAQRIERSLLGVPDPWPEDLAAWRRLGAAQDELEMDVIELLDINHRLLAQEDLASLLGTIVDHAIRASGAQRGFLVLSDAGELAIETALDSCRGGIDRNEVDLSGSALRQALETKQPVRVSNAMNDALLGAAPSVVQLELRSILCVPFPIERKLWGVIYVDHKLREAAFDDRAERMVRLLADQAGLAILHVRRLEEIRRLNRELGRQVVVVQSDLATAKKTMAQAGLPAPIAGLVGSSTPMQDVRHLLQLGAKSLIPVLVTGDSGTGKELAARALHQLSDRASGPFVSESCAALPPSLIEAELFGARKGAFTGADRDREGLFEAAHRGTLFLDEIGELPLELQAKLLRVLESQEVRRLGDKRPHRVDFRFVAATNRNLVAEMEAGRFRQDLYYRIRGLEVHMPSVAARRTDIPELVDHFLRMQEASGGRPRRVAPEVMAKLVARAWPGNVRELEHEIERLCVLFPGDWNDASMVGGPAQPSPIEASGAVHTLAQIEREAIERTLAFVAGDKNKAAELLGISRAKIYQRLKEWETLRN